MFVFKGISSKDMEVIVEEEQHFLAKARQKFNQIDIGGRNDAMYEELGYSPIERPIKIQILNKEKIDKILAWLDGSGDFMYNNRITRARFYNEIEPIRSASISIVDTRFIRSPFWYRANDKFIATSNSIIINEGTVYSEPIVRLDKNQSDNVDFTINNERYVYHFNNEPYVEINSEEGTVQYEGLNRNRQIEMEYQFPILQRGENRVIINSGDAIVKFRKKDRWL